MSKTTFVCLKKEKGKIVQDCDVYIGRKMTQGGWNLEESIYCNKFKGRNCVSLFFDHIMSKNQKPLRDKARKELKNKVLGCWCKGKSDSCHGDVWVYIVDGFMSEDLNRVLERERTLHSDVRKNKIKYLALKSNIEAGSFKDRINGMFNSLFMGDTMGSMYEFKKGKQVFSNAITKGLEHPNRYNGTITNYGIGQVTDDSEMSIILATHLSQQYRASKCKKIKINLKTKKVEDIKVENSLIDSNTLVMDYIKWANSGIAFVGKNTRSLFSGIKTISGYITHYEKYMTFLPPFNQILQEESKESKTKLSNGSLMRCSSLALLPDNSLVSRDYNLTNPNFVVSDIEECYLQAIRMAIKGESAENIFEFVSDTKSKSTDEFKSVIYDIKNCKKRTLKNLNVRGKIIEGKGSAMSGIYATLVCLHWYTFGVKPYKSEESTSNPTIIDMFRCLVEDFPESDTDTNCAIMGALMGAIIGNIKMTEDEQFSENLIPIFDITSKTERPRQAIYHPSHMYKILPVLYNMYEEYN